MGLQKYNWNGLTFDKIWWQIHGDVLQSIKPAARQIINKFIFDQWATNTREFHIHPYRSKACERCGYAEESTDHVFQCPTELQTAANSIFIQEIKDYFQESETPISVTTCIIYGIESWYNDVEPTNIINIVPNASALLCQAFMDQTTIGWRHMVRGRLAKSWETVINHAIDNRVKQAGSKINKKRITSASVWGKKLISLIWKYVGQTWEIRNTAVQKVYTDRGLTREHELLVIAAEDARGIPDEEEPQDRTTTLIQNTDFRLMHTNSIKYWIQNFKRAQTWVKNLNKNRNNEDI